MARVRGHRVEPATVGTPAPFLPYARIFASMLDGVLVAGPDARIVLANEAAAQILEVPLRELLISLDDYARRFDIRGRDGARAAPVGQRALQGEIVPPGERHIRTPRGVEKTIRTSAAPLRDDRGALVGAVVLLADVSAAKAEEERARRREQELRRAHEAARAAIAERQLAVDVLEHGDPMYVLDHEFRFALVNRAWERITGTRREDALGKVMWDLFPASADPSSRYWREFHRAMAEQSPAELEEYYAPLDVWLAVRVYPTDQKGIAVFFRDVTDRKRAEQSLRDSEEKLRLAKDAASMGSWDWNIATGELTWSDRCKALFGLPPDAVITYERFLATVHPDDRERVEAEVRSALAGRSDRYETELRVPFQDGSVRWIASRGQAFFDAEGRPVRMAGMVLDITGRRTAEERVREAYAKLRETDRRRIEFLGVLSHELRNPLAPIRNSIFLLEKLPGDGPQAARARQVIRRQTEHLTKLVDDLLDVTRVSRGKIQLHREILDLRNVVRRTCEDHRSIFEDSEIDLNLDFPAAPVWVEADGTRIGQVIGNLLHNASKFTPARGEVTVRLRARGGKAVVCVHDTGVGMAPEQVARMFEPFTQEDRSLARTRGGLGLGLALSKGLVELHGGTIDARSPGPGKGSEFEITLPLAARGSQPAEGPAPSLAPGARRRVLIVEDNVDAGRTLADVLEAIGHEVAVARDGSSGIALARQTRPDVVLCDLGLPDVDGYEVARTLRKDESLRSTRLVALSGYAQPEDKVRAREAGFDAHLPKPAPLDELTEQLR